MTRKEARKFMMHTLYQMDLSKDFNVDNHDDYFKNVDLGGQKEYCENLYSIMCNKKDEIDGLLSSFSKKWPLARMLKTDLAILRLATIEILYFNSIPDSVSANEAVELAKIYGEDESSSYINAILANVIKSKAL